MNWLMICCMESRSSSGGSVSWWIWLSSLMVVSSCPSGRITVFLCTSFFITTLGDISNQRHWPEYNNTADSYGAPSGGGLALTQKVWEQWYNVNTMGRQLVGLNTESVGTVVQCQHYGAPVGWP
eukprot:TRINITY_DN118887_c0_g1_i1.p1 TRINITY_DN118887_c0_g1~~TRINITY_DN118887_c0_g1_i1.p1  ORF type:complete len:124 (+),score=9.93 TRINITY_DN118887_c0_g1_i1:2-373(+)